MSAVDESRDPLLHRWLSLCRQLMTFHPRVGARAYAALLLGEPDLRPGWNAMHPAANAAMPIRYIFVGTDGDRPYGKNTFEPPGVPASEIHDVYEDSIAPYAGSLAESRLKTLGSVLATRDIPGYGSDEIAATVAAIDAAALEPLRGATPTVDDRIARSLDAIKAAIANGGPPSDVVRPVATAISDCLRFRMSVSHAANVAAYLLARILQLPSPGDESTLLDRLQAHVEYLTERVLALKDERQKLALTPFHQSTYLALLYGDVVLLTCNQAKTQAAPGSKQATFFERRGLFIDETMAHELSTSLQHPIDLVPTEPMEYRHAVTIGIGDPNGIYVGAGVSDAGPVDPSATLRAITSYAATAGALDLEPTLELGGANAPLSEEQQQRLAMFLLAMKLGGGAPTGR